jgi:hypothetical protein
MLTIGISIIWYVFLSFWHTGAGAEVKFSLPLLRRSSKRQNLLQPTV